MEPLTPPPKDYSAILELLKEHETERSKLDPSCINPWVTNALTWLLFTGGMWVTLAIVSLCFSQIVWAASVLLGVGMSLILLAMVGEVGAGAWRMFHSSRKHTALGLALKYALAGSKLVANFVSQHNATALQSVRVGLHAELQRWTGRTRIGKHAIGLAATLIVLLLGDHISQASTAEAVKLVSEHFNVSLVVGLGILFVIVPYLRVHRAIETLSSNTLLLETAIDIRRRRESMASAAVATVPPTIGPDPA